MSQPPQRTGTSFLDDDELPLLDALAPYRSMVSCLRGDTHGMLANCGYSHSLSDPQLVHTIETLAMLPIVSIRVSVLSSRKIWHPMPWAVALTADGADRWEAERTPDRNRFVTAYGPGDPSTISLASPSRCALGACLQVSIATGRFSVDASTAHWDTVQDCRLWYWRQFPRVQTVTMRKLPAVDRKPHEQQRNWWSSVPDLCDSQYIVR